MQVTGGRMDVYARYEVLINGGIIFQVSAPAPMASRMLGEFLASFEVPTGPSNYMEIRRAN